MQINFFLHKNHTPVPRKATASIRYLAFPVSQLRGPVAELRDFYALFENLRRVGRDALVAWLAARSPAYPKVSLAFLGLSVYQIPEHRVIHGTYQSHCQNFQPLPSSTQQANLRAKIAPPPSHVPHFRIKSG